MNGYPNLLSEHASVAAHGHIVVLGGYSSNGFQDKVYSSYVIPRTREVDIDIKPGSEPNSINLNSSGVVPVAILSSDTFDATTIDPATVSLAGARVRMVGKSERYLAHQEDVNGDELIDLVCQVYTAQFMIVVGESVAVLEGNTYNGTPVRGEDSVRIVPDN